MIPLAALYFASGGFALLSDRRRAKAEANNLVGL